MAGAVELRRYAPWILLALISFNVRWIASNIFSSDSRYYQNVSMTPKRTSVVSRKFRKVTTPKDLVHHHSGFSLLDYIDAPVPEDPTDENIECLTGKAYIQPGKLVEFPLCIYDPRIDIYVSAIIKNGNGLVDESYNVLAVMERLGAPREDIGFIDIGANIGVFSLTAAAAGHQVLSVEPMPSALRRLRKSISMGTATNKITVVQAALSNDTGELVLKLNKINKGGSHLVPRETCREEMDYSYECDLKHPIPIIFMDDLLEVIPFKNAIMRIDCEGFEYRAFKRSEKLLTSVNITYIMMEFLQYTDWWYRPHRKSEVDRFIAFFRKLGYIPSSVAGMKLDHNSWDKWPADITWTK